MRPLETRSKVAALAALVAIVVLLLWWSLPETPGPAETAQERTPRYLVGAHYQLTLPEGFQKGFLRGVLVPPQSPGPGVYELGDASIFERHINQAAHYGLDFLCLEYWPDRPPQDIRPELFLKARNIDDIRFCLGFQLKSLGYDSNLNTIAITQPEVDRFVQDLRAAEPFLTHPGYLRFKGRPVIYLRDSHLVEGQLARLIEQGRTALSSTGAEPYFLADELSWSAPREERLRLYDAVTTHQPFRPQRENHAGYGAASTFLQDLSQLTQQYIDATAGQIPVLPPLTPGFNARGRDTSESGILPRQWKKGEGAKSFFEEMYLNYTRPYQDERLPLLLVTSWNEWGHDTSIEPMQPAAPTRQDSSGQELFSGGYLYQTFEADYLAQLQDWSVAVSGTVETEDGRPAEGVLVVAWRDRKVVATDQSDSEGRFHLSRLTVEPGQIRVGTSALSSQEIQVRPEVTTRGVRLLVPAVAPKPPQEQHLDPLFPQLFGPPPAFELERYQPVQEGPWKFYQSETAPLYPAWEPGIRQELSALFQDGDTIVEADPWGGRHTGELARLVGARGRVIALVSQPERYGQLQANLQLNQLDGVETLPFALGPAIGVHNDSEQRTLDSFHFKQLHMLVLHSTAVLGVLEGARETLTLQQPYLLFDDSNRAPASEEGLARLRGSLAWFGYTMRQLGPSQFLASPTLTGPTALNLRFGLPSTRHHLVRGFSRDERQWPDRSFVWSDGTESELRFSLPRVQKGNYLLGLGGLTSGPLNPLQVTILLNGARVDTVSFGSEFEGHEMLLPEGLLRQGENSLLLRYSKTGRPQDLIPGQSDTRPLALALSQLWLLPETSLVAPARQK